MTAVSCQDASLQHARYWEQKKYSVTVFKVLPQSCLLRHLKDSSHRKHTCTSYGADIDLTVHCESEARAIKHASPLESAFFFLRFCFKAVADLT